jgi:large subunit ribosomal protein L9
MQVVLLERVANLGQMGEVVNVKDGYGRNYLLPQGKALRATKANMARFEEQRAQIEARNLERKAEAEKVARTLDGQSFVLIRQASEGGSLYGSVTARDVADAASAAGFSLGRNQIVLDRPVKELGLHPIRVTLHAEVDATITVNVARSQDEAELQAQGKTIADLRAEEEAAEAAEFDVQSLFGEEDEDETPARAPRGMEVVDADGDDEQGGPL